MKTVAATTADKPMQAKIVANAKELALATEDFINASKALSVHPEDLQLQRALNEAGIYADFEIEEH